VALRGLGLTRQDTCAEGGVSGYRGAGDGHCDGGGAGGDGCDGGDVDNGGDGDSGCYVSSWSFGDVSGERLTFEQSNGKGSCRRRVRRRGGGVVLGRRGSVWGLGSLRLPV
jgi:hypothetical protein